MATKTIHRSAITGRFVKKSQVKKSPKTTVTERRRTTSCSKKTR